MTFEETKTILATYYRVQWIFEESKVTIAAWFAHATDDIVAARGGYYHESETYEVVVGQYLWASQKARELFGVGIPMEPKVNL